MRISGHTQLIAHIGYPTHSFKAPLIYNPYFQQAGIDCIVMPMACEPAPYPVFLRSVFELKNIIGALITMPHKITTLGLLDEISPTAAIAGACNAVRLSGSGKLQGDMFDGEGFVRGLLRKGCTIKDARALVVGSGGVGSAISASLANAGVSELALFDANTAAAKALAGRIAQHYTQIKLSTDSNDPAGFDIVVNATPMGMEVGDPLPLDVSRLSKDSFVGEVVMRQEMTAFLQAAADKGCRYQIGTDMLFEQIPAYLDYFGLPTTTAENLRAVAQL